MEFVPLICPIEQLLALDNPWLKRVFDGVVPADRLTKNSARTTQAAYIVNTAPKDKPGWHWLAIWTKNDICEVLDSYGLPLTMYGAPNLLA